MSLRGPRRGPNGGRDDERSLRSAFTTFPGAATAGTVGTVGLLGSEFIPAIRVVAAPLGYGGLVAAVLLLVDHALVRFVNGVYFRSDTPYGRQLGQVGQQVLRALTSVASVALFVSFGTELQAIVVFAGMLAAMLYVLVYSLENALSASRTALAFGLLLCASGLIGTLRLTIAVEFTTTQYAALVVLAVVASLVALCWERYGPPSRSVVDS